MKIKVNDWFVVVANGSVSLYGEAAAGVVRSITDQFSLVQLQDLAQRVRDDNDVDELAPGKGYYPRTPSTIQRFEDYLSPSQPEPQSRALVRQHHFHSYHFPMRELPPRLGWQIELGRAWLRWGQSGYDLSLLHAQAVYLWRWWLNTGSRRIWRQKTRDGPRRLNRYLEQNPRAAVVFYIALTITLSFVFFILIWIFVGPDGGQRILDWLGL